MTHDCITCHHGHEKTLTDANPVRNEVRCFRVRTMRDKRGPECGIVHPGVWGSSATVERDGIAELHREMGDKCGPDGVHWTAKS